MNLETKLRRELVRMLVQKMIFCPIGKDVLDMDTCVVILDSDGDPHMVWSPKGYAIVQGVADANGSTKILADGYSFDTATLP